MIMTCLLGGFFVIEVVVGYITNSMSLVADSFHMLSDVVSLVVGYLALRFAVDFLRVQFLTKLARNF